MKNAKIADKKVAGKITGLTVLEALFYVLSLPLIVILTAVFCVKTYQLVPYYSFWPFVGVILAGVLCLVFIIVVMCISLRKKSKRSILMQTVSIMVAALMLTSFIAVMLDVVLPDILAQMTSNTLFYEDLTNETLASEQAEFNAQLDRKFILLNLLNGNYSPEFAYDNLVDDPDVRTNAYSIAESIDAYRAYADVDVRSERYLANFINVESKPYYDELFYFIYDEYLMTDSEFALMVITASETGMWPTTKRIDGIGYTKRHAMCHAIAEVIYPTFKELVKDGMSNERIAELYENNYASLKNDGYLTYDDSMILYATSGRMTVPVVIRLLLDQGYTYTDGKQAYIENGEVVEPEGSFFLELYRPDDVDAILAAAEADPTVLEWNTVKTKAVLKKTVDGVAYGVGAVVIPVLGEDGTPSGGGYMRGPRQWSILDMDGKNMDVAALGDVVVNLGSLLGGMDLGAAGPIIEGALPPQTLDSLFQQLNGILALVNLGEISPLVDKLLQAVTDVIMEATGGAGLYLNLGFNDDGDLEISIAPTNVKVGMFGYQYMTWMESNNLLFAVMSVMSLREWLYIFGAVSVLLAFAAGMCREIKKRIRDDYENKLEAEAAGGEGADVTDGAEDGDDSFSADASAPEEGASATEDLFDVQGEDTSPTWDTK